MMEPRNRLSEIFHAIGLGDFRPSDAQLEKWGMSITRFNQLRTNKGRLNMEVQESRVLREWLREHFASKHHFLFEDEVPASQRAEKQGQLQFS